MGLGWQRAFLYSIPVLPILSVQLLMEGVKTLLQSSNRSTIWRVDLPRRPPFVSKEFLLSSRDSNLEISLHEKLSHIPGVLRGSGSIYEGKPRLFTEYCERGSFRSFFVLRKEPLSEAELLGLYSQMVRTVRLMHEQGVAHGAISAENWLLTADMQPKLTDFGYAEDHSTRESIVRVSESSEKPSDRFFVEDALRLSKVFYQMATCDFTIQVLSLSGTAVQRACEERGYSPKVSNTICYLLQLHCHSHNFEVRRVLEILEVPPDGRMTFADLEELVVYDYCSFCDYGRPARPFAPCEHRICNLCERRIRKNYGILICERCVLTSNPSPSRTVATLEFEFSHLFPRQD